MLKKIIILGIIIFVVFVLYKKFSAPTIEPFFKNNKSKVDFFQQKVRDY